MFKLLECYMRFFATRRIENENKILYSENETRTQKKQQTKTKWKKKKQKTRIGKKITSKKSFQISSCLLVWNCFLGHVFQHSDLWDSFSIVSP